jgi:medium-chain acyl-[acyl-carrier-protein] hydrolase
VPDQRTSPWLPFGVHSDAPVRLLCLPHAGAGASAFRSWGRGLPPTIGLCPVQPPGRERRKAEMPFSQVVPLVRELASQVVSSVAIPYAIFGHSTGALASFELAREIRRLGAPGPVHLFIAGRRAPQLPIRRSDLARLSLPELAALLRKLGGTPPDLLADTDVLAMIQPLLAADFEVNENYEFAAQDPLSVPITAFAGTTDSGADVTMMTAWREQTTAEFAIHALAGSHFAIFEHADTVHAAIATALGLNVGMSR